MVVIIKTHIVSFDLCLGVLFRCVSRIRADSEPFRHIAGASRHARLRQALINCAPNAKTRCKAERTPRIPVIWSTPSIEFHSVKHIRINTDSSRTNCYIDKLVYIEYRTQSVRCCKVNSKWHANTELGAWVDEPCYVCLWWCDRIFSMCNSANEPFTMFYNQCAHVLWQSVFGSLKMYKSVGIWKCVHTFAIANPSIETHQDAICSNLCQ